jgi:hypothetical protein
VKKLIFFQGFKTVYNFRIVSFHVALSLVSDFFRYILIPVAFRFITWPYNLYNLFHVTFCFRFFFNFPYRSYSFWTFVSFFYTKHLNFCRNLKNFITFSAMSVSPSWSLPILSHFWYFPHSLSPLLCLLQFILDGTSWKKRKKLLRTIHCLCSGCIIIESNTMG